MDDCGKDVLGVEHFEANFESKNVESMPWFKTNQIRLGTDNTSSRRFNFSTISRGQLESKLLHKVAQKHEQFRQSNVVSRTSSFASSETEEPFVLGNELSIGI